MLSIMRLTVLVGLMLLVVIAEGEPAVPPTAPVTPPKLAVRPLMLPRNDPDPKMTHKPVVLDPEPPVPVKPKGWTPPPEPPVQVDMDKAVVPKVVKSAADLAQEDMEKRFKSRPIVIDPDAALPADAVVKLCPGCAVQGPETQASSQKIEAETTHDDVVSAISVDDTVQDDDVNADLTERLNELMTKMNMTKQEKKSEQEVKNSQSLEALSKKLKEKAPLSEMEKNLVKQFQAQFELMDEKKKEIKKEEVQLKNETQALETVAAKAKVAEAELVGKATTEQTERKEQQKQVKQKLEEINGTKAELQEKEKKIEKDAVATMANATGAAAKMDNITAVANATAKIAMAAMAKVAGVTAVAATNGGTGVTVVAALGNATKAGNDTKVTAPKEAQAEALSEVVKSMPTPANEKKLVESLTKIIAKTAVKVEEKVLKIDTKLEQVEKIPSISGAVKASVYEKVDSKLSKDKKDADTTLAQVDSAAAALPAAVQAKIHKAVRLVNREVAKATLPIPKSGVVSALKKGETAAKALKNLAKAMPKLTKKAEKIIKAKTPIPASAKLLTTKKVPAVSAKKVSDDVQVIKISMKAATTTIPAIVPSPESDAEMALAGAKINMYLQNAGKLVTGVSVPPTPTVDFSPKLRGALAKADEALAKLDALFFDGSKKLKAIALRRAKLGEQLTSLGAALPEPDIAAGVSTCCQPHPAPPVLSDLPVFNAAPPVPDFKTPDYKQMNVPRHYIHHVVHVTHTHQYILPTLPLSQMSTVHQATQIFHVDPAAIRSQPVLVTADDACQGCPPTTTTTIPVATGF